MDIAFRLLLQLLSISKKIKKTCKPVPARLIFYVTRPGFEPRQSESESDVLPLYYRALKLQM
ncbi:MAG: hypothetical protein JWN83_2923 [Chitinophagaceae bacterium]|nr:hypothetical protein [Chitinophagaceae bacterium]